MKKLFVFSVISLALGCAKPSAEPNPLAGEKKLVALTANNKPNQKFEYNNHLLVKENLFIGCETNPTDEYTYEYKNGRVSRLLTTLRSLYSSSMALCDPAAGMKSEETFEYNNAGQLLKVMRASSTTEYTYNAKGQVVKQAVVSNGSAYVTTYEYDTRGNLIKQTDPGGASTYYTYDDKINPYYKINHRPQWISAFNKSPNNVIKATGKVSFERTFSYSTDGYPVEVYEDNLVTYKFVYK
ncbi:RHS repeat domain-containing protein [Emticicia sp. TH156]|uniref:RHS repeat domain-containing protein n=1 Tax=Emticicia sp. TH156 TaxID=2067454 RepID=UPI000C76EF35|nr:RHS repeat domain-containing protein [Emticicia sp. TH156]PLK44379.1 hypothetical protein C0V77_11370 [Emticicia sp. TH156]